MKHWIYFICGFILGAAVALAGAGIWAWVAIGAIPLVGGMAQRMIKRKAKKAVGIKPPPPDRGFSLRKRD